MKTVLLSYLFAWLFVLGLSLGSLANLMVHALTGGRWGEPVRPAWRAAAALMPLVAVAFVPLGLGTHALWPWADAPGAWLNTPFFLARSVAYLVVWSFLAWGWLRADREDIDAASAGSARTRRWSAAGLVIYTATVSLASFDWIASLMPRWTSTGFGLVVATGQMLAAAAMGIVAAGFATPALHAEQVRQRFHDLGNLLLMYVLTWMYLVYTQFLVVWSENIPREIRWYVPRLQTSWSALGAALVALHFALPLAILLSRRAKRSPGFLAALAAVVLAADAAHVFWLVAPSVRPGGLTVAWSDPLVLAALGGAWLWLWWRRCVPWSVEAEPSHG